MGGSFIYGGDKNGFDIEQQIQAPEQQAMK